ncbi:hypothetical protein P175DRAFT_0557553 [Aspergillus ochraceoroseus IBT 24754]|uniref:Secreted protein n=1 Tax=Aspergillus ochraceoroseus IBT 24754 TaxID=1392256 RepID=A0A2T5LX46_9EURO|nr:uncharacterized protein P175DRAFT_0557553 [Aspergillus ochraceoroseus IBT 24754]PTU20862.1 hypothetical protein P175DRAFT_0557553 [Aspergillus ochraceoroseus IBT 24754]
MAMHHALMLLFFTQWTAVELAEMHEDCISKRERVIINADKTWPEGQFMLTMHKYHLAIGYNLFQNEMFSI